MKPSAIYQVHKWLAVVAAVATLAWFVSGTLMAVPPSWRTLSPGLVTGVQEEWRLSDAPKFEDAGVSIGTAIETVRSRLGSPVRVTGVRLRRLPGRLAYEIATDTRGIRFVDAISGALFTVDEKLALRIAAAAGGERVALGPVSLDERTTRDCYGPMPTYRIPAADGKGTVFCVSQNTGELHYTDRLIRIVRTIDGWHGLSFVRPLVTDAGRRIALFAFGVVGTLMSGAGVLILFIQVNRWRRRRASSA